MAQKKSSCFSSFRKYNKWKNNSCWRKKTYKGKFNLQQMKGYYKGMTYIVKDLGLVVEEKRYPDGTLDYIDRYWLFTVDYYNSKGVLVEKNNRCMCCEYMGKFKKHKWYRHSYLREIESRIDDHIDEFELFTADGSVGYVYDGLPTWFS